MKTTGITFLLTFAFLLSCNQLFSIDAAYTLKQNQELVSRHQAPNTLSITTAITALKEALEIQPESQEFNYTLLGLALLMKDGALAYTAWNNYFLIPGYDTNKGKILGSVKTELNTIFNGWNRSELTINQRNSLILALAHSRMYELAAMVSNLLPVEKESKEVQEIIEYAKYIKQFETNVYSYFSEIKSGKANKAHFVKKMEALNLQLWNTITSSKQSVYSEKKFKKLLSEKFGTIRAFNLKHSIFYLGHVIFENEIIGTQDNETITCKFKIVDFVYGNALLGWYKNIFLFGGFAGADKQLFQFRIHMNENAQNAWKLISDTMSFNDWKKRTDTLCLAYKTSGLQKPLAQLGCVSDKLKIDSYESTYNSLKNKGMSSKDLRFEFLSVLNKEEFCSDITGHEFRHQMDGTKLFCFLNSRQKMEYNATIASVICSPNPLLALSKIMKSAEKSPDKFMSDYSNAATKILQNLLNWMEKHKAQIQAYDNQEAAFLQLGKLSRQQLSECFESML